MTEKPSIYIDRETLEDLLRGVTGNPLADEEIPRILRAAIRSGRNVALTDSAGTMTHKLSLTGDGKFTID